MKDTLIERTNNLQGNNRRVDEAENQINDLEDKKAKKKRNHNPPKPNKQNNKTQSEQ